MTVRKRGESWVVRVELGKGGEDKRKQVYKRFRTLGEAKEYEREVLARQQAGQPGQLSNESYGDFVRLRWFPALQAKGLRESTLDSYQRVFRLHILPEIGHVPLKNITTLMLDELYQKLLAKPRMDPRRPGTLSARTVSMVHGLISQSLIRAVRLGLLARNPASFATPPRKASYHKEARTWNEAEASAFLAYLQAREDMYYCPILVLLATGIRRGEVLGLMWSDIDWEEGVIRIRRSLSQVGSAKPKLVPTKTIKGLRSIKVGSDVLEALNTHERLQRLQRWAAGAEWVDEDLVFCTHKGEAIYPNRLSDKFQDRVRRAQAEGVPVSSLNLHGLRHTFVTLQIKAGVHSRIISERAGHHSAQYTVDTYGHVDVSAQVDAANVMQGLLRGEESPPARGGESRPARHVRPALRKRVSKM